MTCAKVLKRGGSDNSLLMDCNTVGASAAYAEREIMTILIAFHQSSYRNFKAYYLEKVQAQRPSAFPGLVSYQRFVEWIPSALLPLCAYLRSCFGRCTGISFLDSTSLKVCHNRRIQQHKVFKELAARGKTSVDWFFGFKLHLVVNDKGELQGLHLDTG